MPKIAGVVEAVDLVESRPHFETVVKLDGIDRAGKVAAARRRIGHRRKMEAEESVGQCDIGVAQIRIDLGRKKVVDVGARPIGGLGGRVVAVDDVIGGMLVSPGRPQMVLVDHPKDAVGSHEIMRPYR
jgi:hypothetical protein